MAQTRPPGYSTIHDTISSGCVYGVQRLAQCQSQEFPGSAARGEGGKKGAHKGCAAQRSRAPDFVGATPRSQSQQYILSSRPGGILTNDLTEGHHYGEVLRFPWRLGGGVRLADSDTQGIGGRHHRCQPGEGRCRCSMPAFSLACSFQDPADINGRQRKIKQERGICVSVGGTRRRGLLGTDAPLWKVRGRARRHRSRKSAH